jgi:hypothetical protein
MAVDSVFSEMIKRYREPAVIVATMVRQLDFDASEDAIAREAENAKGR